MTAFIWTVIGTVIFSSSAIYILARFAIWMAKIDVGLNQIYREVYGKDYESFLERAKQNKKK